ncbi:TonB-dependent receptor [Sphingomonas aracearum]|uniref:TonB-dependent receptor n=2 Tax=Sphingomonas aracearum TaxID=2283317 RepID=A0A369VWU7_9SPHN|nr:TonB-dependent receptor [Sphingomonas aracearum]
MPAEPGATQGTAQAPASADPAQDGATGEDIVVTGFRASLNNALADKRRETAAIDSIKAEDIGKFPDSNLAESMQRIPGVALARGDGGEGKNISVRGLGSGFTRVRINGMEGTAQTGASDIYGNRNSGRSFDFNVFPSEIFNGLAVRKTPSADVEEGSLGATVDLTAPKPLDQKKDFVLSATVKGLWNELSKDVDPRGSLLVSKQFDEGRWGILGSLAYQQRNIREVGYSAVDILSANTNGLFCSPAGFTPATPPIGTKGATATLCYPGNPRTSSLDAFNAVYNARRPDLPNTPGSGAYFPRLPRYLNSTQDQKRIGGTLTLQFQPDERTDISLDTLYSRFDVVRTDEYIEAVSFARSISNNGQPMTSIRDLTLSPMGSVQKASFDGVDIRSEGQVDDFVSTFKQVNLNFKHQFSDRLELTGLVGINRSRLQTHKRFQYWSDAIDKPFSLDFEGRTTPTLGFGFDVSDPNNFQYAPGLADGTVLGGFMLQGAPRFNLTKGFTDELNLSWKADDVLTVRVGGQFRRSDFTTRGTGYYTADIVTKPLPAGVTLTDLSRQVTDVDKLWGQGAPSSWAVFDPDKLYNALNLDAARTCGVECGQGTNRVKEDIASGYAMVTFDFGDRLPFSVRGDAGVRYVHTDQLSSAYVQLALASSPTGVVGRLAEARRSYDNWLPSMNIVVEPARDLLLRFSTAKVLSRPELGSLTPSSGVNNVTRTGSVQNPFLDPIKATTFDAAAEWYFRPGSLLSIAYFHKDIATFIQSVPQTVPFNTLGLPDALLAGSNTQPGELFTVSRPSNTPGGKLNGIELNAQIPFNFLSSPVLRNFGVLGNYTRVTSKIRYITATVNNVVTASATAALTGLSKNTASATVFYEDRKFSIRSTLNYRDPFIRGIPGPQGSDLNGNDSTLYLDASASYNLSDRLRVSIEAQNLTDEQNRLFVDSQRKDTLFETRIGRTVTVGATFQL